MKEQLEASISMTIVDAVPCILFGISMAVIYQVFPSVLFAAGAILCTLAGFGKVLWKLILAIWKKDVRFLFMQMRTTMPLGGVLIAVSLVVNHSMVNVQTIVQSILWFPGWLLLLLSVLGFCMMGVCAGKLDPNDVKSNWIEQGINCFAQLMLVCFVILACYGNSYNRAVSVVPSTNESKAAYEYTKEGNDTALIFLSGALTDEQAYSSLMKDLSEQGVDCYIVKQPYHLAFFATENLQEVRSSHTYDYWYLAGHSLGGVIGSEYAAKNISDFDGMIFMASYPIKPLKDDDFRALSILATEDDVLNQQSYEEGRVNFPSNLEEVVISGGNHAQFGNYGLQKNDGTATITFEQQQEQILEAVLFFIRNQK